MPSVTKFQFEDEYPSSFYLVEIISVNNQEVKAKILDQWKSDTDLKEFISSYENTDESNPPTITIKENGHEYIFLLSNNLDKNNRYIIESKNNSKENGFKIILSVSDFLNPNKAITNTSRFLSSNGLSIKLNYSYKIKYACSEQTLLEAIKSENLKAYNFESQMKKLLRNTIHNKKKAEWLEVFADGNFNEIILAEKFIDCYKLVEFNGTIEN